jgi:DNA repair protein RecO (recombination protein O)
VALATTRALVLQAFPYSETSKVLRLHTLEHGLRSVLAKGALRPRSRYGGVLEPFTEGTATFHLKEGRDLHTLGGFELLRSRQGLGRSLVAFSGASLLAELAIRTATEEPSPALYHTLADAWDALAAAASPAEALAAALTGAWAVVSVQGFEPETGACVACGRALEGGEPARFDAAAGGTVCTGCRSHGRVLDPATRAELRGMAAGAAPPGGVGRPGAHRALLRGYLEAQLAGDRPLRSLELFLESAAAAGTLAETDGGPEPPSGVA